MLHISSCERVVLQDVDIGDAFFAALERVGSIHKGCRSLLSSHHHRAGLELMDAMSSYQEAAYERLCRSASHDGVCQHCTQCLLLLTCAFAGLAHRPLVMPA